MVLNMALKMITVLSLVLASCLSQADAADEACGEIDLRQDLCPSGQPRLPALRNQGNTNYCFAYTLTDYYSFLTCSNLSGLSAGLLTNLAAFEADPTNDKSGQPPSAERLNRGSTIENADRQLRARGGICTEQDYSSDREEIGGKPEDSLDAFLEPIWQNRDQPNVLNCTPQALPSLTWRTLLNYDANIRHTIHDELSHHRPVPIDYPGEVVSVAKLAPRSQPSHYVMIVGKKRIDGVCHLLVRDPTPVTETPWVTDNGYVWVPETKMIEQIREVSIGQ